jgi:hypothetical protein
MNTKLVGANNAEFDIGTRVILNTEKDGIKFSKFHQHDPKKLVKGQKLIKNIALHWTHGTKAKNDANFMESLGLSVNFLIEDDFQNNGGATEDIATVYQSLRLDQSGFSQGKCDITAKSMNTNSVGIEIVYKGLYENNKWYKGRAGSSAHPSVVAPIHGTTMHVNLPSEAQYRALALTIWGSAKLLDIPLNFCKDTTRIKDPVNFEGIICHFQLTKRKIDPAGIDMNRIEKDVKELDSVGYNIWRNIK